MPSGESIKRKLKRPIPLRGIERRLYAAVFLVVLFGVVWSVSGQDWQFLERSGSLIIIIAIALAWRDYVSFLGDMERFYRDEFARLLAAFDVARPPGLIAGAMHDDQREKIASACSNAEELISLLRLRLLTTEAALLCLGTFIWGYGSIIGNFLWSFSDA